MNHACFVLSLRLDNTTKQICFVQFAETIWLQRSFLSFYDHLMNYCCMVTRKCF